MRDRPLVLILDDEPDMRMLLGLMLEPLGCDVLEAGDGESAFRLALEHEPDILILDVVVPGMAGDEIGRRLRALGNTAPILGMCTKPASAVDTSPFDSYWCQGDDPKPHLELIVALARSRA